MQSHPMRVCGLKLNNRLIIRIKERSHPMRVCGLKHDSLYERTTDQKSHPMRVCGLKQSIIKRTMNNIKVTPYAGVWIETDSVLYQLDYTVRHTLCGCVD